MSTNLGPEIQAVFKKALSKDPAHRYPDCSGFARDLEEASEYHKAELSGRAGERLTPSSHAHPTADVPPLEAAGPGHQPQEGSAVEGAGAATSLPPGTVPAEVTATMLGEAPAEACARSTASGLQPAATFVAGNYDASGLFNAPPAGGTDAGAGRPDLDSTSPLEAKEHSSAAAGLTAPQVAEPQALPEGPARNRARLVWIAVAGLIVIAVVVFALVGILGKRESVPRLPLPSRLRSPEAMTLRRCQPLPRRLRSPEAITLGRRQPLPKLPSGRRRRPSPQRALPLRSRRNQSSRTDLRHQNPPRRSLLPPKLTCALRFHWQASSPGRDR